MKLPVKPKDERDIIDDDNCFVCFANTTEDRDQIIQAINSPEKLVEALERIQKWQRAYPLKVFPKPDLKKAHKVLKDAGMTLDAISADNMRHVLDSVKDIVEQALEAEKP